MMSSNALQSSVLTEESPQGTQSSRSSGPAPADSELTGLHNSHGSESNVFDETDEINEINNAEVKDGVEEVNSSQSLVEKQGGKGYKARNAVSGIVESRSKTRKSAIKEEDNALKMISHAIRDQMENSQKKLMEKDDDEYDAFGRFVAMEIKSVLDPEKRDFIKQEVTTALFKAKRELRNTWTPAQNENQSVKPRYPESEYPYKFEGQRMQVHNQKHVLSHEIGHKQVNYTLNTGFQSPPPFDGQCRQPSQEIPVHKHNNDQMNVIPVQQPRFGDNQYPVEHQVQYNPSFTSNNEKPNDSARSDVSVNSKPGACSASLSFVNLY